MGSGVLQVGQIGATLGYDSRRSPGMKGLLSEGGSEFAGAVCGLLRGSVVYGSGGI